MTNVVFDTLYKQLNPAQKRAVDAIEGPVMVIAGPGTGKTTILTLRIANILKVTDTAPDNILALTFTESGAYAMRKKLVEIIGSAAYKVNIHTFHGFASTIIEQYPDYFARIIGSRIITEPEKIGIVKDILQSKKIKLLRPYGDKGYYVRPILQEIQILKRENISPRMFQNSVSSVDVTQDAKLPKIEQEKLAKQNEKNLELAYVYEQYEKALTKEKYYDFEDMLLELIRAMEESDNFKLMLQESYQYILADEHQDANMAQNRILELLSDFHDSPNLFIVGDDKQAIYRFQGATLANFLFFTKKYPNALVVDLEHNYRSHQSILDASHSLIQKNPTIPGRERKRLISLKMGSAPIFVTECQSDSEEFELISRFVKKMISGGAKSEEIAILYRDNKHADPMSQSLKAHGVEHRIESDFNILNEPDIVKLLIISKAIDNPADSEILAKALFLKELVAEPAHVAELCSESSRSKVPLYTLVAKFPDTKAAYEKLVAWSHESRILVCADFIQKLIQETQMVEDIVKDANSLERLETLQEFYEHIATLGKSKGTFYLKDLLDYIAIADEQGLKGKKKFTDSAGGVRLMTAHRAKGLEFNHVFIIHAADSIWGNRSSRNHFTIPIIEHARNVGRIEDERRLFYVAMTRARDTVHITYSNFNGEKELLPSQFISEIESSFVDFDKILGDSAKEKAVHSVRIFSKPPKEMGISILKPEFVKHKFTTQPLSVTHLNNFIECPWRYFFVNLIRIPQAQNKHQMYGTAMHSVLRSFFNSYKDGKVFPISKVLILFKRALEALPMGKDDRTESMEKGKRALSGYFAEYSGTWNKRLLTEYAVKGVGINIGSSTLQLTGKLDKIEFLDDRNVVVVDFKTSKPKSRNEIEGKTRSANGNYKRQLIFYKLLLGGGDASATNYTPVNNLRINMQYGEIDFIEPNERAKYKKERFEITDREVEELKKTIIDMANDVIGLKFVDGECDDKECEYCKLGKILNSRNIK